MPFDFSDVFFPTALSAGLNASTSDNVVQVDTLPSAFVTEVQNTDSPEFPLRIGRGQSQERVLVTGINDASTNKMDVSRNEGPYGLSSHSAGARVAHALPSYQANKADDLARKKAELENQIQVLEAAIRDLDSRVTTLET